ncbi:hypothetical protein [Brevundimonas sp.]|uniref:hypothetical protein n=1 Tax=Brevundimonas sp. TaxID=1871086 RepID=UPI003D6D6E2B
MAYEFAFISWEAAATLATGFAAVAAAWCVGKNQIAIQKRQTRIQHELQKLEALKIKTDLFDRRMTVYLAIDSWLAEWVLRGEVRKETEIAFYKAHDQATFLFGPEVRSAFLDWYRAAQVLREHEGPEQSAQVLEARQTLERAFKDRRAVFSAELEMPASI